MFIPKIMGGVIHVGAHHAQEAPLYAACGAAFVVWIEADPRQWPRLRAMGLTVVEAAAGATCGQCDIRQMSVSMCTSLLPLGDMVRWEPGEPLTEEAVVTVPMITLDSLELDNVELLVLDVQGAELQVLAGATELLKSVRVVMLEIMRPGSYVGGAMEADIVAALPDFREVSRRPNGDGWDVRYDRNT